MSDTNLNRNCWITAVVTGLLVWLFTAGFGDLSIFAGLVLGLMTAALFGLFLIWITSGGGEYTDDLGRNEPRQNPAQSVTPGEDADRPELAGTMEVTSNGDAQLRSDKSERPVSPRNDIYGKKLVEGDAGQKDTGQKTAVISTKNGNGTAPPDDLKEIKGVGPKLEEFLHDKGITRFAQIAEWSKADIDHFAELIGRMGGRIQSDDWVGQARILAAGGETEFSKRVEDGGVYS